MIEHSVSFMQKFVLNVSKVSWLKCFWKSILIISFNLVLILSIMTSLVRTVFWCFSKFLAFHFSFSIVIWIVRRSFLTSLSWTRAFKMSTQFVDVIFAALLSLLIIWKKWFHIYHLFMQSWSACNMVSLFPFGFAVVAQWGKFVFAVCVVIFD